MKALNLLVLAACVTLVACRKEKTFHVDVYANCDDCTFYWNSPDGSFSTHVAGDEYVERQHFDAPEGFVVTVKVCPTYPDSIPSAGCWIKVDEVPSGFVANSDSSECLGVSHQL